MLCIGVIPLLLNAQVTITAQLPPGGMIQKEQLWNIILVNNREDFLNVNIRLNLQDAVSGELVMSANTGSLLISKGVKLVQTTDIQPVLYNYNRHNFAKNYLPMGSYIACYQLYHVGEKGEEPLGDECIRFNIDPLSPPLLASPADKTELLSPYPQFSWIPPAPFDMFTSLSYDLLVAEVLEGQSPAEAIQQNTPVYSRSNLNQPYESYASSFTALQAGKLYAWQVVARNGLNYAVKTEVWTFKLKSQNSQLPTNVSYILLDDKMAGTYAVNKGTLHVKYFSFSPVYEASFTIYDFKGNAVKRFKQKIVPGDNYLDFNISGSLQPDRVYLLELTDKENKLHNLSFSINKN